jgi:hypothetical protein
MLGWSVFTHERISPRGFTSSQSILVEPSDAGQSARRHARGQSEGPFLFSMHHDLFPYRSVRVGAGSWHP